MKIWRKTISRAEEAAKEIYKDGIQLLGRRDRNNNIVIHPETMVGVLRNAAQKGYEQAEAETIERACDWLFAHLPILVDYYNEDIHENADRSEFIKLFRKQMEEE